MAEGFRCRYGGIQRLCGVLDDAAQRRALEGDLLRAGLRLRWFGCGDPDYSLADLAAFVATLPQDSALLRELLGEDAQWSLETDLLALVADQLAVLRYALTAKKGDEFPELVSRSARKAAPGDVGEKVAVEDSSESDLNDRNMSGRFVGEVRSTAQIAKELGWA